MPISLILIALLGAYFSVKYRKQWIIASISFLMLLGNSFLINEAYLLWEIPQPVATQHYDLGIILTGGMMTQKDSEANQIFVGKTADRFIQALRLYKKGQIKKIMISGGVSTVLPQQLEGDNETYKTAQILEELGVNPSDIILETQARNTHENAQYCAKLLQQMPQLGTKVILFTSAFHGRRAQGCFAKAGVSTTLFSCSFKSVKRQWALDILLLPSETALADTYQLIHEILGYIVYRMVGYC